VGETNKKHYLLTTFGPAGQQNFSNIQLAEVAEQLDYYNVQGYDFHGTWETSTNHASGSGSIAHRHEAPAHRLLSQRSFFSRHAPRLFRLRQRWSKPAILLGLCCPPKVALQFTCGALSFRQGRARVRAITAQVQARPQAG